MRGQPRLRTLLEGMGLKRFWHRTRLRFIRQPTPCQADRTPVIETAGLTIVYRDFRRRSRRFLPNRLKSISSCSEHAPLGLLYRTMISPVAEHQG